MIIVRIWEGLGNQLFQYAYARALQLRTGKAVYIDSKRCFKSQYEKGRVKRIYSLDNFNITLPECDDADKRFRFLERKNVFQEIIFCFAEKGIWYKNFYQEKNVAYKKNLESLNGNWYLMGWFQNERYFEEYRDILLKELTPKKKIHITKQLKKILQEENTVSVHIRRTDYQRIGNTLSIVYYKKAIREMERRVEHPFYIIFTDDLNWVKENMDFGEHVLYVAETEKLKDFEELLVMSKCQNNIIANSTFSWWAAWLNRNDKKTVIGPKCWFRVKSNDIQENIMPKEWIRI